MSDPRKFMTPEGYAKLEAAEDAIYTEVGRALTAWSQLEEDLCQIYILAVCPHELARNPDPAGASFWSIMTFDGKLNMATAAVRPWLRDNETLDRQWSDLTTDLGNRKKDRNDLAHGTVAPVGTGATFFPSHFRTAYTKPHLDPKKPSTSNQPKGTSKVSRQTVRQWFNEFIKLRRRVNEFHVDFYNHLAQRGALGLLGH